MPACIEPGCFRLCAGTRCDEHERKRQRNRNASRTHYRGGWEKFARQTIDAHVFANGPVCAGWKREPHTVTRADLTLDHIDPRSAAAGFQVLCRSCNSSKGNADAVEGADIRR